MQLAFVKKLGSSGSVRNVSLLLLLILGCATPQPVDTHVSEERQHDYAVGVLLAQKFETQFQLYQDSVLSTYLEDLATVLAQLSSAVKQNRVKVQVVEDLSHRWTSYAFPVNQIYLSRSLIRSIRFENELAAVIALEIAHLENRDLITRFEKFSNQRDLMTTKKLFEFSSAARIAALELAMEMMYQAGYDQRGMVYLLGRYQKHPERSPYDSALVKLLMENSRRIIALHAPIRNPIVRSDRFLAVFNRMQKL